MARPIRIEFSGGVYHCCARGNARQPIFRDDDDRERWLETVAEMHEQFGVLVHAFTTMPNHYHAVIETPRPNLSQAVGWLQTTYTIRFNRRHRRSGHLFQGRFKAHLVDGDAYARSLVCYVHLNPVRPRDRRAAIPADRAGLRADYRWSSHLDYAGEREPFEWLDLSWLRYWGRGKGRARAAYRQEMGSFFGRPIASPWDGLRAGLVLGGAALWDKVRDLMDKKNGAEEARWRERLTTEDTAERARSLAANEPDRRVRIWARVCLGGERKVDVAQDFGYRDGSGVLQVVKRMERSARKDKALANKLDRMKKKLSSVD